MTKFSFFLQKIICEICIYFQDFFLIFTRNEFVQFYIFLEINVFISRTVPRSVFIAQNNNNNNNNGKKSSRERNFFYMYRVSRFYSLPAPTGSAAGICHTISMPIHTPIWIHLNILTCVWVISIFCAFFSLCLNLRSAGGWFLATLTVSTRTREHSYWCKNLRIYLSFYPNIICFVIRSLSLLLVVFTINK